MRLMSASIAATALITAARAALKPRMAAERPATPSLAFRAWSINAVVSARGSRTPAAILSWQVIDNAHLWSNYAITGAL